MKAFLVRSATLLGLASLVATLDACSGPSSSGSGMTDDTDTCAAGASVPAGALDCPRTLEAYCMLATSCPPTMWSEVQDDLNAGTMVNGAIFPGPTGTCGPYDVVLASWSSTCGAGDRLLFLFDSSGQEVAAIEQDPAGREACLGGPASLAYLAGCTNVGVTDGGGAD